MIRTFLLLLITAQLIAFGLPQDPQAQVPSPPRHDQFKDDPVAYCWNPSTSGSQVKHRETDTHAHKCECHLRCSIGPDNQIIGDQETSNCKLYCTRDHCLCHVESPCEMSHI